MSVFTSLISGKFERSETLIALEVQELILTCLKPCFSHTISLQPNFTRLRGVQAAVFNCLKTCFLP
jgi:hypothetical protein